jgi:hypothetical protein
LHSVLSELGLYALKRISSSVQRETYINKIITAPKRGERNSRLEFHTSIDKSNGKSSWANKKAEVSEPLQVAPNGWAEKSKQIWGNEV